MNIELVNLNNFFILDHGDNMPDLMTVVDGSGNLVNFVMVRNFFLIDLFKNPIY